MTACMLQGAREIAGSSGGRGAAPAPLLQRVASALPRDVVRAIARVVFVPTYVMHRVRQGDRWCTRIDERLMIGGYPLPSDLPRLRREGVVAILSLCEEMPPLVRCDRMPMVEFVAPTNAELDGALDWIRRAPSGTVYVHCKAGKARSAAVAARYWMSTHRSDAAEAHRAVRAMRDCIV